MEDSSIYDDEVIPGSDEEENGLIPQTSLQNDRTLLRDRIPPVITQDTIQTPFDGTMLKRSPISSISDGTTGSSSRPKPRLPKKRADNDSSMEKTPVPLYTPIDTDFSMATDIAERAKMRSRNSKSQTQPILPTSDIIELTSDDDDDFDLLPPSKRRKTAAKVKTKSAKKSNPNSELVATTDPKPRPRPRLLKKTDQGAKVNQTSPNGLITHDDPIPTSSNPSKLVTSQLPPSDPPSSTASSCHHPPITTLSQMSTDHNPSSPSSLFSSGRKNRGHAMMNVDELDSDPDPYMIDAETRLMPPPPHLGFPPPFLAGSSSPVHHDRPPATIIKSGTKTSAVKKSRKKVVVSDDDEDDGAWGTSKPKAKAKQKKTTAKKAEVVIEQPTAKGKGKEKEVFKSREFIDNDDDDDDDPSNKVPATPPTASKKPESPTSMRSVPESGKGSSAKAKPSKKRKSVDRGDDELDTIGRTTDSSEPKRCVVGKRVIDSDDDMSAHSLEGTKSPKAKEKTKSRNKSVPAKRTPISSHLETNDAIGLNQQADNEKGPHDNASKENTRPPYSDIPRTPQAETGVPRFPSLSSRYTVAPKNKSTPMSDLIRRVNSKPGSPFRSPAPRMGGAKPPTLGTAYSPYVKASRRALSHIAPLHPNRRTPPPPPPPLPPKKKTKKELEREEQWEEELIESVGGITEWACMPDAERAQMRKAKRESEMYGWED